MRIAIYGAGAIGTSVGGRLAEGGLDVTFIARGAQLQALNTQGLDLTIAGQQRTVAVRAAAPGAALPPQDVVLIATKALALPDIAATASAMLAPDGVIVPAINGVPWWLSGTAAHRARLGGPLHTLDPGGRLAIAIPQRAIIGCGVYLPATLTGPGQVMSPRAGFLSIGEPDGGLSERAERLAATFTAAGMPTQAEGDVVSRIWAKLLTNMAFSPLSALTGAPAGTMAQDPDVKPILTEIMEEGLVIARALGLDVTEQVAELIEMSASAGRHKPSLLKDVEAGRPTELEHILGAPVEIAGRLGLPLPVCTRILALARLKLRELNLV